MKFTFAHVLILAVLIFGGIASYAPGAYAQGCGGSSSNLCGGGGGGGGTVVTVTLTATPTTIAQGQSSLLSWESHSVTTISSIDSFGVSHTNVSESSGGQYCQADFNMGGSATPGTLTLYPGPDSSYGGPDPGSVYVSPSATKTYHITCGFGPNVSPGSASATVTVTGSGIDLTAGSISPTSATPGTAQTFSATVSNTGDTSTGAGFTDLFQKATDSSGTGATDIGTYASAAIPGGGSNTASLSYSFSSAGTYYMRACADKSSAGSAGVITESNENNNCGPWTAITAGGTCYGGGCAPGGSGGTPGGPGPGGVCQYPGITQPSANPLQCCSVVPGICAAGVGPSVLLSATPSTILDGSSASLTWTSQNAVSCSGSPTDFAHGAISNLIGALVSPSTDTTYSITCSDQFGNPATSSALVSVIAANLSVTPVPASVRKGEQSTISWSAVGSKITSCTISGPGLNSSSFSGSSPQVINAESTYTLSCIAGPLRPSASATVKLIPSFKEI